MGLDKLAEKLAAGSVPRFALFREGRALYEAYWQDQLAPMQKDFCNLGEEDFKHAALDRRLNESEEFYARALAICRHERDYHDIAVSCYQLGLLTHLQGRFPESRNFCTEALEIADSLPRLTDSVVGLISGCCYHLGILAARNAQRDLAKQFIERSLRLDESVSDIQGASSARKALVHFVERKGTEGTASDGP